MPYYEKWPIFCNLIKHKTGFSNKQKADRRIIILGLVNALDTNAYGKVMKLYTIQDNVSFYINKRDTINHLTNSLPCIDDSYQHDKAHDGYYWFIGTAFPQERKNSEYITPIIDEGTIIQVSREHIPLNTIST